MPDLDQDIPSEGDALSSFASPLGRTVLQQRLDDDFGKAALLEAVFEVLGARNAVKSPKCQVNFAKKFF